jgi:hypothetical protein
MDYETMIKELRAAGHTVGPPAQLPAPRTQLKLTAREHMLVKFMCDIFADALGRHVNGATAPLRRRIAVLEAAKHAASKPKPTPTPIVRVGTSRRRPLP